MPSSRDGIEAILASRVAAILAGGDPAVEDTPPIASLLGRLLERALEGEHTWSRYAWIDDADPLVREQTGPREVSLTGVATVVDGDRWSLQPFRAMMRLDGSRTRIESYRLCLGDPDLDLHAIPVGSRVPRHWPGLATWRYDFARPEVAPQTGDTLTR